MKIVPFFIMLILVVQFTCSQPQPTTVSSLKVTTLSTMLANRGIGEWGYSALVEVDGNKILFDTGNRPETVLQNAQELGIDLSDVEDVYLSHNHGDHTGGILTLRAELKKENPKAMSRVHVGRGIFADRVKGNQRMQKLKETLEADGVTILIYEGPQELFPGVWTTGPVARVHNERNWGGSGQIKREEGFIEDNIPEDQSLAIRTANGFVMISGCGHAGIVNTITQIQTEIDSVNIHTAIGGFHLANASDEHLQWTADHLQTFGVVRINGAHCTGLYALYTLQEMLALDRASAIVGSVGDVYELDRGLVPGIIAR